MKRIIGNVLSTAVALVVGALTIYASLRYLKKPEVPIDYIVLVLSGVTTATIGFIATWGHFQKDPVPELPEIRA